MPFYILHPKEIERVRKEKSAIVVDVRQHSAYRECHYKNAINIPYKESGEWEKQFRCGGVYILYCDYGNISLMAARKLVQRDVIAYSVIGGMNELKHYIL